MRQLILFFVTLNLLSCSSHQTTRTPSSHKGSTPACVEVLEIKGQKRKDCAITTDKMTKKVHLLELKGTLPEVHYAQGYLMAQEIQDGAINEMLENFNKFKRKLGKYDWAFDALLECYVKRIERSVDQEVRDAIVSLHQGYQTRYQELNMTPKWGYRDIRLGTYGIELGNILYGQLHTFEKKPLKAVFNVIGSCGGKLSKTAIERIFQTMLGTSYSDKKMGCVGMVMPGDFTQDGHLIHGRNLDQTPLMQTWAQAPVMYSIHETNHIPYLAVGTAGLIFPGGISGFNQHGISVSLHQMNTERFKSKHRRNSAALMPFLQQRILREARSIKEAEKIVKETKTFSSWTILISDAKSHEAASFELSAHHKAVARRSKHQPMAQSNHFLDEDMQKEHFHSNYASFIETQSRLLQMQKTLDEAAQKEKVGLSWALNTMASHQDYFEGERSFGRTAVKASNIMTSVAIPGKNQMWMTIGDYKPAAHSHYLGVEINFQNGEFTPIGLERPNAFQSRTHWEKSFQFYVEAYYANTQGDRKLALEKLQSALEHAQKDKVDDTTYRYNLARLLMLEKRYQEAQTHWNNLRGRVLGFHPYQQTLVKMFDLRNRELLGEKSNTRGYDFEQLIEKLEELKTQVPFGHGVENMELKITLIRQWLNGEEAPIPNLDFAVLD